MRKNQKHSKERMFALIKSWQQSGLSQHQFCKQEKLSTSTFGYWLKKYKYEKADGNNKTKKPDKTFLPVKVTPSKGSIKSNKDCITIT